jgi:hypothetical protein
MTKMWGFGFVVVAVLCLTGCGGGSAAAPTPTPDEAIFLSTWHERFPGAADKDAIAVAKDICAAYKAGTSFAGEVQYLMTVGHVSAADAGAMIGEATSTYCPEYNSRH